MKTAVIIKHEAETKWLVMKYLDEAVISEDWCNTQTAADEIKASWEG